LKEIKIFSGSSHPALAEKICQQLGISLSPLKIKKYANGCFEVILGDNVCDKMVFLIQTSLPDLCCLHRNLWEFLQMINASSKAGAEETIAVMPYISYARSDKIYTLGMTISGELLVKLLETSGIKRFVGIDFHSKEFGNFFSNKVKVYHSSTESLIAKYLEMKNLGNAIILPGDKGAFKGASSLAKKLKVPVGFVKKIRISDTKARIVRISVEVAGKDVVFFDDEISPVATTLTTLGKELEKRGAKSLMAIVTHASITHRTVLRLQQLNKILKEIVVTDTVPISREAMECLPVKVLSVAELLAQTIRRISGEK